MTGGGRITFGSNNQVLKIVLFVLKTFYYITCARDFKLIFDTTFNYLNYTVDTGNPNAVLANKKIRSIDLCSCIFMSRFERDLNPI